MASSFGIPSESYRDFFEVLVAPDLRVWTRTHFVGLEERPVSVSVRVTAVMPGAGFEPASPALQAGAFLRFATHGCCLSSFVAKTHRITRLAYQADILACKLLNRLYFLCGLIVFISSP